MVNTLFKSKIWKSTMPGLRVPTPQTLQLYSMTHGERAPCHPTPLTPPRPTLCLPLFPTVIEENGVKLKLTVTDTPGFGDQINNDKW